MTGRAHNILAGFKNRVMYAGCIACTAIIIGLLVLVSGYLITIGWQSLNAAFFTSDPIPLGIAGAPGGMRNAILGTLILILLASVVGVPMGMVTGIFLSEYEAGSCAVGSGAIHVRRIGGRSEHCRRPARDMNCSSPPPRPDGFRHVPYFKRNPVPSTAGRADWRWHSSWCRSSRGRPRKCSAWFRGSYREASIALGATKAATIIRVVLPTATSSIVTGVMLAVARVAGETAPLLFTALASDFLPVVQFERSVPLHSRAAESAVSVTDGARRLTDAARDIDPGRQRLAWAGILVLIALVFVLNLSVRLATRQRRRN
jgi:phosphate transport system permease protein